MEKFENFQDAIFALADVSNYWGRGGYKKENQANQIKHKSKLYKVTDKQI